MSYLRAYSFFFFFIACAIKLFGDVPTDSIPEVGSDSIPTVYSDSIPGYYELEGVEVTARKPLIQTEADRLTYNVDEDPVSTSSNALEMMRKIPMLSLDGEDNVKLKGESNFKIYLNGKPDPTLSTNYKEVLRSMPASTIKKIEVITEPGAKYDAEGLAGIINIVTFSSARIEGYLLNLGLNATNNYLSEYLYGTTKIGNVTLSGNYSHSDYFGSTDHTDSQITYTTPEAPYAQLLQQSRSKYKMHSNFAGLQMSWEPDTLNLYTASVNFYNNNSRNPQTTYNEFLDNTGSLLSHYTSNRSYQSKSTSVSTQANWQHNFRIPERNIVLSYKYDYNRSKSLYPYFFTDIFNYSEELEDYNRTSNYPTHEHTFQADYTNPFSKKHTLEVGGKYILRNNFGHVTEFQHIADEWIENAESYIDMKQFQSIASIYVSYTGKFGKFLAKAGLRYEFTHMGTRFYSPGHTDFTTNFSDPVPNVLLTYKLTDTSVLKATYRMQVQRPSVSQLDPSINTGAGYSMTYGNPDLTSQRSHIAGFTYSNFGGKLGGEFSANYLRGTNLIAQYSFVNSDGIICTTYGNLGTFDGVNLSAYVNWRIFQDFSLNVGGSARYSHFHCPTIDLDSDGWGSNLYCSADYSLPSKWQFSAYYGFYQQGVYLQYKSSQLMHWHGVSVSKTLCNDRLTLSLSASDFLTPTMTYDAYLSGPGYDMIRTSTSHNWGVSLGVRFRLGNLSASVKQTTKSVSNDDLSSGGSSGSSSGKR